MSVGGNFIVNRMAPIPRLVIKLLQDNRFNNETIPENIRNQMIQSVAPIMMQVVWELAQEDPNLLPLAIPAAFGVGIQTYGR